MAPKQFFMQDDFGNYHYGYATQDSERSEESNGQTVKGHYTYIMADGQKRRVDYIADSQGFHILRDDADITNRIKREAEAAVEPDLIRTRMRAVMDSTSLMDDNQDMYSANNMMGRDMTSMNNMMLGNRLNNQMSSNMYRSSDLMNLGSNLMGSDMSSNVMDKSMMGRQNMYTNMMGRDMSSNMMGHNLDNNMMGRNMENTMMGRNMDNSMMGRDMSSNMMGHNIYNNMMGRDMTSNMNGVDMTSNMVGRDMNRMSPVNMMSQRMQIEQVPAESFNQFY